MASLKFVKLQVVTLKLQNVGMIVVEVIKTLRLSNDTTIMVLITSSLLHSGVHMITEL